MRALLYLFICLLAGGCMSTCHPSALDEAQSLMHSDPAAALSKLNGVDVSDFKDSATMARWALLYTEALTENRLSAPTDTIVNIAIDYYSRTNQASELSKANRLKTLLQGSGEADALASALYLQKEKEYFLYRERAKREQYMLIGIIVLIIAAGLIAWMRQRLKLQSLRNDALMAEASGLQRRVDSGIGTLSLLESRLRELLEDRFSLIDSLCQTYYETQGTKTERKAIIEKVKNEITSMRTDSFPEMERAVNNCRNNILASAREAFPNMKDDDYRLLVYLACGLSTRSISLLLDESVDVIYKRKSRLKSRLRDVAPDNYPEIMSVF